MVCLFVFSHIPGISADEVFLLIQLCIRFSVPLVIMTPDGLWQTRPGNISSWFWQSISDGGGVRATVSVFIIWFVIRSDSCYSNHCSNHSTSHDPQILQGLFQHFNNCLTNATTTKVYLNCTIAPSVTLSPGRWLSPLTWYITRLPTKQPPPSPYWNVLPAASKMFGQPIIL